MRGKERARQLETVPVSEVAPPPTRTHRVPALVDDADRRIQRRRAAVAADGVGE